MQHIINSLQAQNFVVTTDEFDDKTPMGLRTFRNIIGTYNVNVMHRLVLACHYDSKIMQK